MRWREWSCDQAVRRPPPDEQRAWMPLLRRSRIASKDRYYLALRCAAADFGPTVFDGHIEFAAHAELAREIDARFDREASAIDQHAMVAGFERVEIAASAVNLAPDGVAGAMDELIAVA